MSTLLFKYTLKKEQEDITESEKKTARDLINANADNYDAQVKAVCFYHSIEELEGASL